MLTNVGKPYWFSNNFFFCLENTQLYCIVVAYKGVEYIVCTLLLYCGYFIVHYIVNKINTKNMNTTAKLQTHYTVPYFHKKEPFPNTAIECFQPDPQCRMRGNISWQFHLYLSTFLARDSLLALQDCNVQSGALSSPLLCNENANILISNVYHLHMFSILAQHVSRWKGSSVGICLMKKKCHSKISLWYHR